MVGRWKNLGTSPSARIFMNRTIFLRSIPQKLFEIFIVFSYFHFKLNFRFVDRIVYCGAAHSKICLIDNRDTIRHDIIIRTSNREVILYYQTTEKWNPYDKILRNKKDEWVLSFQFADQSQFNSVSFGLKCWWDAKRTSHNVRSICSNVFVTIKDMIQENFNL